jgi:hypothetical protein
MMKSSRMRLADWIERTRGIIIIIIISHKNKGKVQPITGHQGPRGKVEV